jgi:hypothetical protein
MVVSGVPLSVVTVRDGEDIPPRPLNHGGFCILLNEVGDEPHRREELVETAAPHDRISQQLDLALDRGYAFFHALRVHRHARKNREPRVPVGDQPSRNSLWGNVRPGPLSPGSATLDGERVPNLVEES